MPFSANGPCVFCKWIFWECKWLQFAQSNDLPFPQFNDACLWIKSKDLHSLMLKKGNKNMLLYTIIVVYFMSVDFC